MAIFLNGLTHSFGPKMTIFSKFLLRQYNPIMPKKKKLQKLPFLDHKHALTPLGKKSIFQLFELLVFIA